MADYTEDDNVVAAGNDTETIEYEAHYWKPNDIITAEKLNQMEAGIKKGIDTTISQDAINTAVGEKAALKTDLNALENRVYSIEHANYATETYVKTGLKQKVSIEQYNSLSNTVALHEAHLDPDNETGKLYLAKQEAVNTAKTYTNEQISDLETSLTTKINNKRPYTVRILTQQAFDALGTSDGGRPEEFTYYLVERKDSNPKQYDKYWYVKDENSQQYLMDSWGGTSTKVVSSLPSKTDANLDTDYILNNANGCFYYKLIDNEWKMIAGSKVEFVNEWPPENDDGSAYIGNEYTDYYTPNGAGSYRHYRWINDDWQMIGGGMAKIIQSLTNETGNEYTDYYVPITNTNPQVYQHYRWKANNDGGDWIQIGSDAYSKAEIDNKQYLSQQNAANIYATKTTLDNYYTKTQADEQHASKTAVQNLATQLQTTVKSVEISNNEQGERELTVIYNDDKQSESVFTLDATEETVVKKIEVEMDENHQPTNKLLIIPTKGQSYTVALPKGGGGGGSSSVIYLTNVQAPNSVSDGDEVIFSLTATASDASQLQANWYVNGVRITTQANKTGSGVFSIDVGPYLRPSAESSVTFEITSSGGGSARRTWPVTSSPYRLTFSSNINSIMLYTTNDQVSFTLNVASRVSNIIKVRVKNDYTEKNKIEQVMQYTAAGSTPVAVKLNNNWFQPGKNIVTAEMIDRTNAQHTYGPISFVAIWGYNVQAPVVAFAQDEFVGTQFEQISLGYLVYDPAENPTIASITIYEQVQENVEKQVLVSEFSPNRSFNGYDYTYNEAFDEGVEEKHFRVVLTCKGASAEASLIIQKSDMDLGYINNANLVYNLDPSGHSNTDTDREEFGKIVVEEETTKKITFSDNFNWLIGGFQKDKNGTPAFVVKKGDSIKLPRSLFEDGTIVEDAKTDNQGKVIDLVFKITNSDNYNAQAIKDLDSTGTKGLILSANGGQININTPNGSPFLYTEETIIELSIHIEKYWDRAQDEPNQRLLTIWLDGIPTKALPYTDNALLSTSGNLQPCEIGSPNCDIWLYALRVYDAELTKQQMIQNYISNGGTFEIKQERYQQNDIFDANGDIVASKLATACPNLTIVTLGLYAMSPNKNTPKRAAITIQTGNKVELEVPASSTDDNSSKDGGIIKVQGTSSAAYGRSAYNLDLDFRKLANGEVKTYQLSPNSIPVSYLNIKVNVASSENANNINAVDWYNKYQPFLTESRRRPGVRDVVEGKPCAVFIRNENPKDAAPVWFSSQLIKSQTTVLYAMGDLCNSKKNLEVFGQDGYVTPSDDTSIEPANKIEHPTLGCIEVSGNDSLGQRFLPGANYMNVDIPDDFLEDPTKYENIETSPYPSYVSKDGEWQSKNLVWNKSEEKYEFQVSTDYEWRMEPTTAENITKVVNAWNATVKWVMDNKDDLQTFKSGIDKYFSKRSLLYHFLFIEFFAAYDNVSKNTFYSFDYDDTVENPAEDKWGGYRWNIKAAYDWDTILGCDNDGAPLGDYGLDFKAIRGYQSDKEDPTIQYPVYYFNAADNPIWNNIKQGFQDELSTMYKTLRQQDAWNTVDLLNKWNTYQMMRPHAAMVIDAYNKYIKPYQSQITDNKGNVISNYDASFLVRLNGSKIYQRERFLKYQTYYMDGKYKYFDKAQGLQFRTNATTPTDLKITAYAKTQVSVQVDDHSPTIQSIDTNGSVTFSGVSTTNNATIYISPQELIQSITPLYAVIPTTFVASGALKLIDVTLGASGYSNSAWTGIGAISIGSSILQSLSIEEITNYAAALPVSQYSNLSKLNTKGTGVGEIILPPYAPLKTIELNACTGLSAVNLQQVETLTMEAPVGKQVGASLNYLRVENCNDFINNKTIEYLQAMKNNSGSSFKNLRLIFPKDKTITLTDTSLLNWLLEQQGINDGGQNINSTAILEGKFKVPTITSIEEANYNAAWGSRVIIEYTTKQFAYNVKFYDWDGTVLKTDVIVHGQQVLPPNTPERESDEENNYVFGEWYKNGVPTGLGPWTITEDSDFEAQYIATPRQITVNWIISRTTLDGTVEEETILTKLASIGDSLDYETEVAAYNANNPDNPLPLIPSDPNSVLEKSRTYRLFKGWDKSTGYIRAPKNTDVLNVRAQYETISDRKEPFSYEQNNGSNTGRLLNNLSNLTPSQFYAITEMTSEVRARALEGHEKQGIKISLGHDFHYTNVDRIELATNLVFDGQGKNAQILDYKLFDTESETSWTLMIDYRFAQKTTVNNDNNVLLSCFDTSNDSNKGFKLQVTQQFRYPSIRPTKTKGAIEQIGTSAEVNNKSSIEHYRSVVVLRHRQGDENFQVYHFAIDTTNDGEFVKFTSNSIQPVITKNFKYDKHDNKMVLGGTLNGSEIDTNSYGQGVIYSAVLWKDALSENDCKKLAIFPHETHTFEYICTDGYKLAEDSNKRCAMSFISASGLSQYRQAVTRTTNNSDLIWDAEHNMSQVLNKIIFPAFPLAWQSLIKTVITPANCNGSMTESNHKLYLLSLSEVALNDVNSQWLGQETSPQYKTYEIPWFKDNTVYVEATNSTLTRNETRIRNYVLEWLPTSRLYRQNNNPDTSTNDTLQTGDIWTRLNPGTGSIIAYYISAEDHENNPLYIGLPYNISSDIQCTRNAGGWYTHNIGWMTRTAGDGSIYKISGSGLPAYYNKSQATMIVPGFSI